MQRAFWASSHLSAALAVVSGLMHLPLFEGNRVVEPVHQVLNAVFVETLQRQTPYQASRHQEPSNLPVALPYGNPDKLRQQGLSWLPCRS